MRVEMPKKMNFKLDVEGEGPLTDRHTAEFLANEHFDEIYIRRQKLFSVADAKKIEVIRSVFNISIWCDITRAAVRYLISRPNLTELVLFGLKPSGRLSGFENARNMKYFSCLYGLNGSDLLEVAKLPSLQKLGAQRAHITEDSILALLEKPLLTDVDFEDSNFDDNFAGLVARSTTITSLELGCNRITKIGLEKLCSMTQLKKLDIWSVNIVESDIDMLAQLPNLDYLSLGGHDEQTIFTVEGTLARLYKLPSLKKIWLDGFRLTRDQRNTLNERYEEVTVT